GHRRVALELHHALRGARHAHAAAPLPAGGLARLGLETAVEIDAVADEPGEVARRPELPDQPRRVPGGPAEEAALLEQHHVAPPELRQVIRDARADDAAADHDGPRLVDHGATGRDSRRGRRYRSCAAAGRWALRRWAGSAGAAPSAR